MLKVLLAVVSAYYLGFQSSHYFLRTRLQKYILIARSLATLVLALLPILRTITLYCIDRATIPRCSQTIATPPLETICLNFLFVMMGHLIKVVLVVE